MFHFQPMLFSVLGAGWIVVIYYCETGKKAIPFLLGLFVLICFQAICNDETRVVCIITFPLIATFWLLNEEFLKKISVNCIAWILLIWLILPWMFVWGTPKFSVFSYDIIFLLNKLFGVFTIPVNATWPFQYTQY